ncbi:MAG: TlpA family protein disulfide reductase [Bacteroidales bacterium]|nr:TlpA family protein disulfide reductase [Bacteroidales bacterium]
MKSRIVVLLMMAGLFCSCIKEKQTGADLVVGDVVPDFTVVMSDGSEVTGAQLREGVSCIVFFTTACPDCRQVLPHLQRLRDEYHSQGVRFAFISREEGAESIQQYWMENGYTMPFSAQTDRYIYELFAASRVPRIYICRDGLIKSIFTDSPTPSYEELAAAIDICIL